MTAKAKQFALLLIALASLVYATADDAQPRYLITNANGEEATGVVAATDDEYTVRITQTGMSFSQEEVRIPIGGRIAFFNEDDTDHNVYCHSPKLQFNLGRQEPGAGSVVKFTEPGNFLVRCAIYPDMRLNVFVE